MFKDSKNLFFSTEVAASLGLEEAIIFSLISDSSIGVTEKKLRIELSFIQEKRFNDALSKLLSLELIEKTDSKFILKNNPSLKPEIKNKLDKENTKISKQVFNQAKSLGIPEEFILFKYEIFFDSSKTPLESNFKKEFKFLKYLIKEWRLEEKNKKKEAEKVLIQKDWFPSEDVISILETTEMDSNFIKKCIPEFIVYWQEKQFRSNNWNSIFINHVRRQWVRYKNIIEDDISPKKMTNDWEPNQNCLDVLKLARIDENFARNQIPEFKLYWIDSNQVMTSWNSKFIQHVKFKWYKNNSESSGIISRLTDKDWAIEY